ncbi:hypothetical protein TNCV_1690171 [Trichonephila clavipes]|nr:hypothetical protein TNCV_1690171 [Trichonephila clavipes]
MQGLPEEFRKFQPHSNDENDTRKSTPLSKILYHANVRSLSPQIERASTPLHNGSSMVPRVVNASHKSEALTSRLIKAIYLNIES